MDVVTFVNSQLFIKHFIRIMSYPDALIVEIFYIGNRLRNNDLVYNKTYLPANSKI